MMMYSGSLNYQGWPAGSDFVRKRRGRLASSWDVPDTGEAQQSSSGGSTDGGAYYGGSSGNAILDALRNAQMSDALAGISAARSGAMTTAPNDPSLAASSGLRALLQGQGQAARTVNSGAIDLMKLKQMQDYEERMRRAQAANSWIGDITGLAGMVGGVGLSRLLYGATTAAAAKT